MHILLFVVLGFYQDNASMAVLISLSIEIYFNYLDYFSFLDLDIDMQPWVIAPLWRTCINCFLKVYSSRKIHVHVKFLTILKQLPVFCFPILVVLVYIYLKCF